MPLQSDSTGHTRHWPHRTRHGELRRRRHLSAHRATRLRAKTREAKQSWSDRRARRAGVNVSKDYNEPGTEPLERLNALAIRRTRRPHRHRDNMRSYIRSKAYRTSRRAENVRKYTRNKITHTETMTTREYLRGKAHRARLRAEGAAARKRERWGSGKRQDDIGGSKSLPSSPPYAGMRPYPEDELGSSPTLCGPTRLSSMPMPVRRNTMSDSEQDEMGEPLHHQSRLHRHLRRRRTEDGGILR